MLWITLGSIPKPEEPCNASPDSLSKIRLNITLYVRRACEEINSVLQISSSIMSSANILHFDLSSGCTVQALIASLKDLGAAISPKKVKPDPISLALVQKTEACLLEAGFKASTSETNLITQFCILLTDLDPKAISATRIPLSFDPQHPGRTVLLKLSEFVPIYETEWRSE